MNSETFLKRHQSTWESLSTILTQIDRRGLTGISQQEIKQLGILFRRVTAHLSYARANYPEHDLVNYLNGLVIRTHGHIYKSETLALARLWGFFSSGFPRLVREQWRFVFAAAMIFLAGALTGCLLYFFQPALAGLVVPESWQEAIKENLVGHGQASDRFTVGKRPLISMYIMANNIWVGCKAFVWGVSWGCGTVYVLFFNGLLMGVLAALVTHAGYAGDFWPLILPHGMLELTAIFLCGGAGFLLAKALVKPGDYTRRNALLVQGKIAVKLIAGTIPLFIIAALIEGFITPSLLSNYVKFTVAACSFLVFIAYVVIPGNRRRHSTADRRHRRC